MNANSIVGCGKPRVPHGAMFALLFGLQLAPHLCAASISFEAESGVLGAKFTNGASGEVQFISISTDTVNTGNPGTSNRVAAYTVAVLPLAQPQFSAVLLNANQLVLQIAGASGPDYQIQASTNLANWSAVFTTNSPVVPFSWTNSVTNSPMNFFRVLVGPPF